MNGKNIIALVVAIVIGVVAFKLLSGVISFLWALLTSFATFIIVGGLVYFLYRKFNNMLSSGKRLT